MKKLLLLLLVFVIAGCDSKNNSQNTATESSTTESTTDSAIANSSAQAKKSDPEKANNGTTKQPGEHEETANGNTDPINTSSQGNSPTTDQTHTDPQKTESTKGPNETTFDPSPGSDIKSAFKDENGDEAIIFIGTFAKWKPQDGVDYDGSYDTLHNLFVICETDKCQAVPKKNITLLKFGTCDLPVGDRIKMFNIKKGGKIDPNGIRIQPNGTKGIIKQNGIDRFIEFDPKTITRIKDAGYKNNLTYKPQIELMNEKAGSKTTVTKEVMNKNMLSPNEDGKKVTNILNEGKTEIKTSPDTKTATGNKSQVETNKMMPKNSPKMQPEVQVTTDESLTKPKPPENQSKTIGTNKPPVAQPAQMKTKIKAAVIHEELKKPSMATHKTTVDTTTIKKLNFIKK